MERTLEMNAVSGHDVYRGDLKLINLYLDLLGHSIPGPSGASSNGISVDVETLMSSALEYRPLMCSTSTALATSILCLSTVHTNILALKTGSLTRKEMNQSFRVVS